jgi:hypothetical protein
MVLYIIPGVSSLSLSLIARKAMTPIKQTCAFEVGGKVYKADAQILKLLTYEGQKGNHRVAAWLFALYLAAGRIEAA